MGSHPLLWRHLSNGIPGESGLHGTILETEAGLLSDAKPASTSVLDTQTSKAVANEFLLSVNQTPSAVV